MLEFLGEVVLQFWAILKDASIFLLAGFALAGFFAVAVSPARMKRFIGTGRVKSVFVAAAVGSPLPLCSCGVVPAAIGLKRQGASDGATVAFLVATPEIGVDSVAVSYALTDLTMTIFRPVAAFCTAVAAGIATNLWGGGERHLEASHEERGDDREHFHAHRETHADHGHGHSHAEPILNASASRAQGKARRIARYAFIELFDDTSHWIVLGIALSAVVAASVPDDLVEQYLGSGDFVSMLAMLLIGIPLYTCASSSTPLAAALVMKGMNPGAALVFLLAGPATNIGSIVVLLRFLGARVVAIYLASIAVVALLAGYALNWVYSYWKLDPRATFGAGSALIPEPVQVAGAILFIALTVMSFRRAPVPREWLWARDRLADFTGFRLTLKGLLAGAVGAGVLLYLGTGLFAVRPGEIGVRTRFGEIIDADLQPGLHLRLPWPIEDHAIVQQALVRRLEVGLVSSSPAPTSRQQYLWFGSAAPAQSGVVFRQDAELPGTLLLTGDGNLVDVRLVVQYQVDDVRRYLFNAESPEALARGAARSALGAAVATSTVDELYTTGRRRLEDRVGAAVEQALEALGCGLRVVSTRLVYVHAPDEVHDAFRDVASAQEDKLRTINRAKMFAIEMVNGGRGEAAAMLEAAEAFRLQRLKRAEGDGGAFRKRVEAYGEEPELAKFRLRMEAAEQILTGTPKFVMPRPGDVRDVDLWLFQPFAPAGRRP